MPDQFIALDDVQREAAKLRIMLDQGVGDTDQLYAAYNALLMVLDYGVMPPSEMWRDRAKAEKERPCAAIN